MMKKQTQWSGDSKIHNFEFPEIVTQDGTVEEDEYVVFTPDEPEVTYVAPVEPPKVEKKSNSNVPKEIKRHEVWVLPLTQFRDPLYGEVRSSFDGKVKGEVIVAASGDIDVSLWSTVEFGRGSIVYMCEERRWWRVQDVSPKADGFLYQCMPSDFQPTFE